MKKIQVGDVLAKRELVTIRSEQIQIPHPEYLIHLQFRRYAGCPICNLHLHSIARRYDEIVAAGIREVAVFHSSLETMLPYQSDLPFNVIADPKKKLYAEFGVESSLRSFLHLNAVGTAIRGVITKGLAGTHGDSILGLPADFLIATDGRVLARKYGTHANDQWSVDDLLSLASTLQPGIGTRSIG